MVNIKSVETVCIRCGKTRVFAKRWVEKADGKGTVITYEESVCPDKECQKLVDEHFEQMRNRRLGFEEKKNTKNTSAK